MIDLSRRTLLVSTAAAVFGAVFAPSRARAAGGLDRVQRAGKLVTAFDSSEPPWSFLKDGKHTGYNKDVLDRVAKELGLGLEEIDIPFQGMLPGLLVGKFDVIAGTVTVTPDRAKRYAMTSPVATSASVAIRRKDDGKLATPKDLNGKIVAAQRAAGDEQVARNFDKQLKDGGGAGFKELVLYGSPQEGYLSLQNGTVDAMVSSTISVAALNRARPGLVEIVGPLSDNVRYSSWALRAEDTDLRDRINQAFAVMRKDGTFAALQDKWIGLRLELPEQGYLPEGAV